MTNAKGVLEWMEWKEKREREMTNEDWFDTLSTKEKAEAISRLSYYRGNIYEIEEWLKQPHEQKGD